LLRYKDKKDLEGDLLEKSIKGFELEGSERKSVQGGHSYRRNTKGGSAELRLGFNRREGRDLCRGRVILLCSRENPREKNIAKNMERAASKTNAKAWG